MKTNYREKHEFEDDNQPHDFRGMGLCMCGLPEDNPLHLTPKQTTGEWNGKKLCDCPCKGPFCDTLIHICDKPDEHYSQRENEYIKIRLEERTHLLDDLEEGLIKIPFIAHEFSGDVIKVSDILTLVSKMRGEIK